MIEMTKGSLSLNTSRPAMSLCTATGFAYDVCGRTKVRSSDPEPAAAARWVALFVNTQLTSLLSVNCFCKCERSSQRLTGGLQSISSGDHIHSTVVRNSACTYYQGEQRPHLAAACKGRYATTEGLTSTAAVVVGQ
jgi:hypothetical protein